MAAFELKEEDVKERNFMLEEGYVKRIHVIQQHLRLNRKDGGDRPTITIQTSKGPIHCREVAIDGPSVLTSKKKRLSCGASVYIETNSKVIARM